MQINGASNVAGPPPGGRPPGGGPMKAGMDAAADMLGLERQELKSALESGQTLADLANEAGVSTDDLEAAMAEAITAAAPPEVAERLTANLGDVIAGERPPRPPRPQQTDKASAVDALAEALDTTTEDLLASIESGSLTELFEAAGFETQTGVLVNTNL